MKLRFFQGKYGSNIELTPENVKEVAELTRVVKNSKKETPRVSISFPEDGDIKFDIQFRNVAPGRQENYISFRNRK